MSVIFYICVNLYSGYNKLTMVFPQYIDFEFFRYHLFIVICNRTSRTIYDALSGLDSATFSNHRA